MSRLNATLKHEEEVQKHLEDNNLGPYEVALYVLEKGSTGQKISTLQHFDKTLSGQAASGCLASSCPAVNGTPTSSSVPAFKAVHNDENERKINKIDKSITKS